MGSIVVQTWIYHPSGVLLHAPGDVLTSEHAAAFAPSVLDRVLLQEATEERRAVRDGLGVALVALSEAKAEDVLSEEVSAGRTRHKAGTALEPAVVESLAKEKVPSVLVCRGATPASIKWARTYLDTAPQAPVKMIRPDPLAAAATTAAWSLLTPRAKVMAVFPDDMARLRIVNAVVAAGHEVIEVKAFADVLSAAKAQRPDAVLVPPEGAIQVCDDLRRKGETLRSIVICVTGEAAKLATVGPKAIEAGANDVLQQPATPGLLADRVRSWMRLRNKVVAVPASVVKERRQAERRGAAMTLRLADSGGGKSPVTTATLLDFSDGGLRLEYGLLEPPDPGHYRPHGVHPGHALFAYAKENKLGRDLIFTLTGKDVPSFESRGRVAHILLQPGSERVGVSFLKARPGAAERVTTIQRKPLL